MSINLTKDTIDLSKTYRTRDGRPVTLLHRRPDGWPSDYPYVGLINGVSCVWLANGRVTKESIHNGDLVEAREPKEGWVPDYFLYETEEAAKSVSNSGVAIRVREIID